MKIRKSELKDLPQLLHIYNYEVENGVATLDINAKTYEERLVWFEEHNVGNHPLIVAEENGVVMGYASLSSYREKEAYKTTVELSVYVGKEYRSQGVATALMEEILNMAKSDETVHNVVSVITAGNRTSCHLHEKFGFTYVGKMRNVAVKFDNFLDVEYYELLV